MNEAIHSERRLKGTPLSPGRVIARLCMFNERRHTNLPVFKVSASGLETEKARVLQALEAARGELDAIRADVEKKIGKPEAEIFVAQKMIMEDPTLLQKVFELIVRDSINAEKAITVTLDAYEARLQEVDNEYIRERASDFGEVKRRILDTLGHMKPSLECVGQAHCERGRNRIIVAREMTPSLTVDLDPAQIRGFLTERGGATSHGAILARALGIPAVSGLPGIRDQVSCGMEVLINGDTGEVILWPSADTLRTSEAQAPKPLGPAPEISRPVPGLKVLANIGKASDVQEALALNAEGIGLYRTELEVMTAGRLLDEDELSDRYAAVVTAMAGRPVVFRAYDIGSDKPLPSLAIPPEENPSLGWRGARLLLGKKHLLTAQARALARVSRNAPVQIMYPMIVDLEQFLALKNAFEEAIQDLPHGRISHGLMFEVPSACIQAREMLEAADFGSIGTNDLIQYLFAVDRNNEFVAYDFRPDRAALWALLKTVAEAAAQTGKPLSVCGEIAGDPRYVSRLMDLGIDTVSVNARSIAGVRQAAQAATARKESETR